MTRIEDLSTIMPKSDGVRQWTTITQGRWLGNQVPSRRTLALRKCAASMFIR